ncbi:GyrI-like domain-containing protein [Xenophilus sp.]|uniref:GyrI-like domain-containing protein n=1 Tax=Xenophilus sp. TaxID=1873499 RepID=UPI0037DCFA40
MEPTRQQQEAFSVAGLRVRTTNAEENAPATMRIGGLWQRFFAEEVYARTPHRTADDRNFGVYANYESDADGAFDVIAGVAVSQGGTVQVAAGDYLVFEAHGEMPQAVLDAWQRIWRYFEAHPEIRRSYRSDFEAYTSPTDLTIHIGVE